MPQEEVNSSTETMTINKEANEEATNNGSSENFFKRSGGAYIPPGRLRLMQQQQLLDNTSPDSEVAQRIAWDALKRSINGLINKVNASNIKAIIPELFGENLLRGRGLFCKSIMRAQSLATPFTPVYASLAAVINSKLPDIGKLLLERIVYQFQRVYRRNDRVQCISLVTFIAHLVNQQVASEVLGLQVIGLLLERPTADSVELAVGLTKECGQHLAEHTPKALNIMFDQFRDILHQGDIDKRVQYMVEVLFQVRKDKFKDNPAIPPELDLVEDDDRIVHEISLDDDNKNTSGGVSSTDKHNLLFGMDIFKMDPKYLESQKLYEEVKKEILGSDDEEDEVGSGDESGSEDSDEEEDQAQTGNGDILDKTGTNITNLRRQIYLTIMSSANFMEASHKLMSMKIAPEDEVVLCSMIIDCCAQERTYMKFYSELVEQICKLGRKWAEHFEFCFKEVYESIHRYDSNKLRNVSTLFGYLFSKYALPLPALSILEVNEETSTASSRIFIKQVLSEMAGILGYSQLNAALKDPDVYPAIQPSMFPTNSTKGIRFAINYYTAIGLAGLTEELRVAYESLNTKEQEAKQLQQDESSSDSDSSPGSESDSDYSSSDSDSGSSSPSRSRSRSRRRIRHGSRSASPRRSTSRRSREPIKKERSVSPTSRRQLSRRSPSTANRSSRHHHRSPTPVRRDSRERRRSPSVKGEFSGRRLSRRSPSPVSRTVRGRRRSPSVKSEDSDSRYKIRSPSSLGRAIRGRRSSRSVDRSYLQRNRSPAGRPAEHSPRYPSAKKGLHNDSPPRRSRSPMSRTSRPRLASRSPENLGRRDQRYQPADSREGTARRLSSSPANRTSRGRHRSPSLERNVTDRHTSRRSPNPSPRFSRGQRRPPSVSLSRSPVAQRSPLPPTTSRPTRRRRSPSSSERSLTPKRRSTRRSLSRSLSPPPPPKHRDMDSARKSAFERGRDSSHRSNSSANSLSPYSRRRLL